MLICCCRNMFTAPLPSNRHLFSFSTIKAFNCHGIVTNSISFGLRISCFFTKLITRTWELALNLGLFWLLSSDIKKASSGYFVNICHWWYPTTCAISKRFGASCDVLLFKVYSSLFWNYLALSEAVIFIYCLCNIKCSEFFLWNLAKFEIGKNNSHILWQEKKVFLT
jgi:hypothetical protein